MESMEKITIGNLIKLRECASKKRFAELALSTKPLNEKFFVSHLIGIVKDCMMRSIGMDETIEIVSSAIQSGYQRCWFHYETEMKVAQDSICAVMVRLIHYMYDLNAEVLAINVPCQLHMDKLPCKGEDISEITGAVDLVLKFPDGTFEGICFSQKEIVYSYLARKEVNKVDNALELIYLKLCLEGRYPGIRVSLYYLKNKDDTAKQFMPYEHKKGKNIVSSGFSNYSSMDELMQHFIDVLAMQVIVDCEKCVFNACCKFNRVLRDDGVDRNTVETTKEVPLEKKEVVYTEPQKQVIFHKDGPLVCMAVPGAGKTFSLVERMLYLIKECKIPASKLLYLTFTDKACGEIKERVVNALGTTDEKKLPVINTINGFGYNILQASPTLVGKRVKLAGPVDRMDLIGSLIDKVPRIQGVSYNGLELEYGLLKKLDIEFQKIEKVGVEQWSTNFNGDVDGFLRVYDAYKKEYDANSYISYDEQISLCNEIFDAYPELAVLYSKFYRYIMVDEFQDVSEDNVKLIYSVARQHNNIVVVGDDDQSIYAFRGGSNKFMIHFNEDFVDAKTVIMNDNFRSNNKILEVSDALISNNKERVEKHILAHKEQEFKPLLLRNFGVEKLPGLVSKIVKKGYRPGDIAILGRYNKSLYACAKILSPYYNVNSPKDYLIDDPVFLAIYDLLTLYYEKEWSDMGVYRLFSLKGCENSLEKKDRRGTLIENILRDTGLPPYDVSSEEIIHAYMSPEVLIGTKRDETRTELTQVSVNIFHCLLAIKQATGIKEGLEQVVEQFFGKKHKVSAMLSEICEQRAIVSFADLYRYMKTMVLFQDQKRIGYEHNMDAINLLTAHDSKGKEFPVVIICAVEEFPDTEEERRLLYVAMTRAKSSLFVLESEYMRSALAKECEQYMAVH